MDRRFVNTWTEERSKSRKSGVKSGQYLEKLGSIVLDGFWAGNSWFKQALFVRAI
jgi:hypothetical protein